MKIPVFPSASCSPSLPDAQEDVEPLAPMYVFRVQALKLCPCVCVSVCLCVFVSVCLCVHVSLCPYVSCPCASVRIVQYLKAIRCGADFLFGFIN